MRTRASLASAVLLLAVFAASPIAQTVDDVIEKHLTAIGGREVLGKLTSRRSTGTVTLGTPMGDISGPVELSLKAPNKSRIFMKIDLAAAGAGEITVDQRFDGTTGIAMNSMQGDTPITGGQLENLRNNIFPSPLLAYKAAGMKVELLPKEKVDGKDALVLRATPKTGPVTKVFLDAASYLIMQTVTTVNNPQLGDIEQTSAMSDYRAVDGVKVPFRVVNSNSIQSVTIVISKVEHNVAMADSLFVK